MNNILILRDLFIRIWKHFDYILRPLGKFLLAFFILFGLQSELGYFERLNSALVIAIFSLLSAFFPLGAISFIAGIFLILDMLEVSYIIAAVATGVLILILLLYYGFKPGTGIVISLVPAAFFLGVPELIPVLLGLNLGLYAVVPALCGVLSYNVVYYFMEHSSAAAVSTDELTAAFMSVIRGMLLDKFMILAMFAFAVAIIAAAVVSRLSINYARLTAVVASIAAESLILIYASSATGRSVSAVVIGSLISLVLSVLYVLIFYAADYSAAERLEFEDDDYYYYVKAVPKIKAQSPEDYM